MASLSEYIWPITTLITFLGMLALCWRSLSIAHDLAKTVLAQTGPMPAAPPKPTPIPPVAPAKPPAPAPAPTGQAPAAASPLVVDAGLVAFIKKQEGFVAKAAWDYKQYTNGYGTKALSPTEVIDEATAVQRLTVEIDAADKLVEAFAPGAPKGVKQALTDLTFNAGAGWEHGGLGEAVKAGDWTKAKTIIPEYNHAEGQVLADLTRRREAEVSWFDNPL